VLAKVLAPLIGLEGWVLENLHALGLGWGLAIVALTLLVRAAIVPLTVHQFRAQRKLITHAPELKRLRENHRKDPDRLKQELAAYSREHGVNPLGAFAPILIQIPIFVSLYFLMREDVAKGLFSHEGFLFIPDLTARPHGAVLVALVAFYLASQLGASLVATRSAAAGQRKLALVLPFLFLGVATRFPAGLLLYWITSSVWSLGQQLMLGRVQKGAAAAERWPPEQAAAPAAEPRRRPHPVSKTKERRRRRSGRGAS
jgi:YidC/Oxa1 family membrane protein insertase